MASKQQKVLAPKLLCQQESHTKHDRIMLKVGLVSLKELIVQIKMWYQLPLLVSFNNCKNIIIKRMFQKKDHTKQ